MKRLYYSQVPINEVPVNVKYHFTSPIPRLTRSLSKKAEVYGFRLACRRQKVDLV